MQSLTVPVTQYNRLVFVGENTFNYFCNWTQLIQQPNISFFVSGTIGKKLILDVQPVLKHQGTTDFVKFWYFEAHFIFR